MLLDQKWSGLLKSLEDLRASTLTSNAYKTPARRITVHIISTFYTCFRMCRHFCQKKISNATHRHSCQVRCVGDHLVPDEAPTLALSQAWSPACNRVQHWTDPELVPRIYGNGYVISESTQKASRIIDTNRISSNDMWQPLGQSHIHANMTAKYTSSVKNRQHLHLSHFLQLIQFDNEDKHKSVWKFLQLGVTFRITFSKSLQPQGPAAVHKALALWSKSDKNKHMRLKKSWINPWESWGCCNVLRRFGIRPWPKPTMTSEEFQYI